MSRNNDVFQVLVPTSATVAPTGTTLTALAAGAIGAFGYESNVALDPTATPTVPFYLAVKVVNLDGVDDIVKSSGTHIQPNNIVSYTHKGYTAAVDMVTNNTMKVLTCGGEMGVKIEIRNQEAYRLNGFNQVVKNYIVPTSDCTDCDSACEDTDCVAKLDSLIALINADPDGVVVATKTVGSADCSIADQKLILTVNAAVLKTFCDINLGYFFPHQTEIVVTPVDGFEDTVIATAMVYEDGNGYDVKQLEYEAGGWNGKPGVYRASEVTGVAIDGFQYFADASKSYDVFHASYNQKSVSGWRADEHFLRTVIAAEDGAIGDAIKIFLDVIFA